jgi:hypothetical protein
MVLAVMTLQEKLVVVILVVQKVVILLTITLHTVIYVCHRLLLGHLLQLQLHRRPGFREW